MRVMIIVPAFAESQQRNPPTVAGVFAGFESPSPPHVRCGVDQPGRMECQRHAQKDSPQHDAPTAKNQQRHRQNNQWNIIEAIEQNVISVCNQVRGISLKRGLIVILRGSPQDPTHMRPPPTIPRCMRIAHSIRVRMMNAMCRDPLNRSTFERQRSADNQKILDRLWYAVATMSEEPMKAHPNAAATDPIQNYSADERRPAKEK